MGDGSGSPSRAWGQRHLLGSPLTHGPGHLGVLVIASHVDPANIAIEIVEPLYADGNVAGDGSLEEHCTRHSTYLGKSS